VYAAAIALYAALPDLIRDFISSPAPIAVPINLRIASVLLPCS